MIEHTQLNYNCALNYMHKLVYQLYNNDDLKMLFFTQLLKDVEAIIQRLIYAAMEF